LHTYEKICSEVGVVACGLHVVDVCGNLSF
jgi:hypothetical protein